LATEPSIIEEFQASAKVVLLVNQLKKALYRVAELTVENQELKAELAKRQGG
jgi:hypothetical protein